MSYPILANKGRWGRAFLVALKLAPQEDTHSYIHPYCYTLTHSLIQTYTHCYIHILAHTQIYTHSVTKTLPHIYFLILTTTQIHIHSLPILMLILMHIFILLLALEAHLWRIITFIQSMPTACALPLASLSARILYLLQEASTNHLESILRLM